MGHPNEDKIVVSTADKDFIVISTDGDKLFELPNNILLSHKSYSDGLLGVCDSEGKWGYIDQKGKQVIPCRYDVAGVFKGGRAVVANVTDGKTVRSIIGWFMPSNTYDCGSFVVN